MSIDLKISSGYGVVIDKSHLNQDLMYETNWCDKYSFGNYKTNAGIMFNLEGLEDEVVIMVQGAIHRAFCEGAEIYTIKPLTDENKKVFEELCQMVIEQDPLKELTMKNFENIKVINVISYQ